MPIEIRELIIRSTISDEAGESPGEKAPAVNKREIVEDCVEQVLEILKRKEER